jgi:hypothetical protein
MEPTATDIGATARRSLASGLVTPRLPSQMVPEALRERSWDYTRRSLPFT